MLTEKLYTIKSKSQESVIIKLSDSNHPVFKAHFPQHPILPGFMNFEIASELFDVEIKSIRKAKFLKNILPSSELIYKRQKNKFKVLLNDEEMVSFVL